MTAKTVKAMKKNRRTIVLRINGLVPAYGGHLMGEEKPDEELMGKRKSSPRLSTTSIDVDTIMINAFGKFYTSINIFL